MIEDIVASFIVSDNLGVVSGACYIGVSRQDGFVMILH